MLLGALVGAILGFVCGSFEAHSIAEQAKAADPSDPLDMLHMVIFAYLVLGAIGGTLLGLLIAAIVSLTALQNRIDKQKMQALKS